MRRTVVVTSTVVAVAAAVTVNAAMASPAVRSSGSGAAGHASKNITVVERGVTDTFVDIGPSGDSRGDLLTFANPIYNRTNSHRVGHDNGSCIRTLVPKAWECSWTTFLPGGSLAVEGPFYDTHDSVLAITGGTGIYSRARGEMTLHALNANGSLFRFAFKVQP